MRWAVALTAVVVLLGCSSPGDPHGPLRDSATAALYDSIGKYDVIPITRAGISDLRVEDLNDSGVVVGFFATGLGLFTPFRWYAGNFDLLSTGSAQHGSTRGVNARGEIVGHVENASVIWRSPTSEPERVFPDTITLSSSLGINRRGDVFITDLSRDMGLVRDGVTGAITRIQNFAPEVIDAYGNLHGRDATPHVMYPTLLWYRPPYSAAVSCFHLRYHTVSGVNDSSDVIINGGGPNVPDRTYIYRMRSACPTSVDSLDVGFSMRQINNRNWLAGSRETTEVVMVRGMRGYAVLDSVLMGSGGASASWRVDHIYRMNDAGTFLVAATDPAGMKVSAVLVRRPR